MSAAGKSVLLLSEIRGFLGISGGLATASLPSIIGIGPMTAFMFWVGCRG